jgi:hypothetical protein
MSFIDMKNGLEMWKAIVSGESTSINVKYFNG